MHGLKLNNPNWLADPYRDRRITFTARNRRVAHSLAPGSRLLIYATSPLKRIVGAVEVTGTVEEGEQMAVPPDQHCPVVLPCRLLAVGEGTQPGPTLEEASLGFIRPMPGLSYFSISQEQFEAALATLQRKAGVQV